MEKIKFYTKSSISSTPELKMVIDVSGNVGIGESNPTKALEVVGDISFNGNLYQNGSPFQGGTLVDSTTDLSTNSLSAQTTISANNLTSDILKVGNASINNQLFSIESKQVASDGANSHNFGNSVSLYNNKMIVGAFGDDDNGSSSGSAYIFDASTGSQLHKLTPSDGAYADEFGRSVSIYDNYAIIAARYDDDNGENSGSAYIFNVTTGAQLHKLTASDGVANDYFGESVSIYGNNALVGKWTGSAYIFNVTTGNQVRILTPSDSNGSFGRAVNIYDNYAIIGDSNTNVYIFNVSTGNEIQKITGNSGQYGRSVAINNNYAVVGARFESTTNGSYSGSAYIYNVSTGAQLYKIISSDGTANDYFGTSVAIHDNYVIVGADSKNTGTGSVYIFNASSGIQTHKFTASDAGTSHYFGRSVSISNNYAIIGAANATNNNGNSSGAVYTFSSQIFTGNLLDVSDNVYIQSNVGLYVSSPQYTLHVDGTIAGSSAFVNTSDNRVKHNEQPVTNALSTISKLTPKHYFKTKNKLYDSSHNFILDASGNPLDNNKPLILNKDYTIETGIIAQEIQTIPELDFVVHETIPLGVDYNSIHCTHIAATKELYELVQTQQQEINNLKQENQTLTQQIQIIEQHLGI